LKPELHRFVAALPEANFGIKQPDALKSVPANPVQAVSAPNVKSRTDAVASKSPPKAQSRSATTRIRTASPRPRSYAAAKHLATILTSNASVVPVGDALFPTCRSKPGDTSDD
jgi:hypothetical protein